MLEAALRDERYEQLVFRTGNKQLHRPPMRPDLEPRKSEEQLDGEAKKLDRSENMQFLERYDRRLL